MFPQQKVITTSIEGQPEIYRHTSQISLLHNHQVYWHQTSTKSSLSLPRSFPSPECVSKMRRGPVLLPAALSSFCLLIMLSTETGRKQAITLNTVRKYYFLDSISEVPKWRKHSHHVVFIMAMQYLQFFPNSSWYCLFNQSQIFETLCTSRIFGEEGSSQYREKIKWHIVSMCLQCVFFQKKCTSICKCLQFLKEVAHLYYKWEKLNHS